MQQVAVRDLTRLIGSFEAGRPPLLLDVREAWEVQAAALSVPGARTLHIPMNEVPERLAELGTEQPIFCLCHHGMRSLRVAAFLEHQGFEPVFNVAGGIDAWSREVDASVPTY